MLRVASHDGRELTASERVAAGIRHAISTGELTPGDHIRQEKWAARFDVSRLPVREALKLLASEGLLVHDRNRGYFVAQLDVAEMSQIYLMRRLLEPELIATVRWPSAKELARLRELARLSEEAQAIRDTDRCMALEREFDFTVYELSSLSIVVREVKRLWSLVDPYRYLVLSEPDTFYRHGHSLARRHGVILDAIEAQDRTQLREALMRNYDNMLGYFSRPPFIRQ